MQLISPNLNATDTYNLSLRKELESLKDLEMGTFL